MAEFADISIDLTANGMGKIVVNGEDISNRVVGVTFQCRVGQPLVLNVQQLAGTVEVKGQGVVRVEVPREAGQTVAQFLDRLDPATLDEEVLGRGDLENGVMHTAIEILKEKAGIRDLD